MSDHQIRALTIAAILMIAGHVAAAEPIVVSPLAESANALKQRIAAAASCAWIEVDGKSRYRPSGQGAEDMASLALARDGRVDYVSFRPVLAKGFAQPPSPQQRAVMDVLAALFPTWADSRNWMARALDGAQLNNYHTSIRVDGTSIYVREGQESQDGPPHAYVVLTTKKDLREFKAAPCWSDEQGVQAAECQDAGRYDTGTLDNPILNLK